MSMERYVRQSRLRQSKVYASDFWSASNDVYSHFTRRLLILIMYPFNDIKVSLQMHAVSISPRLACKAS